MSLDPSVYAVRPVAVPDYAAVARINSAIEPETPESADEVRHWDHLLRAEPGRWVRWILVDEVASGTTVAYGALAHTLFNFHPRKLWVSVYVDPAHEGRGIGRELYSLLEKQAVDRDAICLWGQARADRPRAVRFLEERGFQTIRTSRRSRLDLTQPDPAGVPDRSEDLGRAGLRFTTLTEEGVDRPEVRRRFYELSVIAQRDTPRMGEYHPISFEEFVQVEIAGPKAMPEATFLACVGEEYVAWSSLEREDGVPGMVGIGFTGTLPKYRGRGVASELKRRAVRFARDHGFRTLITYNDSENLAILAINGKLGFRTEIVRLQVEKRLGPEGD